MLYIIQIPQKKKPKLTSKKNEQGLHLLGDHLIKEAIMFHTQQRLKKSWAKTFFRGGKRDVVLYIPNLPYPPPPKKKHPPPTPPKKKQKQKKQQS